ncbi:hypothetical protein B0H19DRAFT_969139, partial [Mycena capillaripes]
YPMERFCGSLLPAIKSRRHPWASIDRRILELAQLFQLKAVYSLASTLDLRRRRKVERSGMSLAGCKQLYLHNLKYFIHELRRSAVRARQSPGASAAPGFITQTNFKASRVHIQCNK